MCRSSGEWDLKILVFILSGRMAVQWSNTTGCRDRLSLLTICYVYIGFTHLLQHPFRLASILETRHLSRMMLFAINIKEILIRTDSEGSTRTLYIKLLKSHILNSRAEGERGGNITTHWQIKKILEILRDLYLSFILDKLKQTYYFFHEEGELAIRARISHL